MKTTTLISNAAPMNATASRSAAVLCRFSPRTSASSLFKSAGGPAHSRTLRTLGALFVIATLTWAGHSTLATSLERTPDHDYDAPAPGSYTLPVVKPAADGDVLDSKGRELKLSELTRGRITVMSFIYTRCAAAKACPMATGVLRELHILSANDPALAKNMRLVSMSFDPGNDTPERMAAYSTLAHGRKNASEWRFITTASQEKLSPILEAYGQAVDRKANPKDPTGPLNHTLRVFLMDRDGNIRNIYSSGTLDVRLVLADVKTLLLESSSREAAPLTPEMALQKAGEVRSVAFQVKTAARVTDITDQHNPRPLEVLLTDALNDEVKATPVERAGIIVRIPVSSLEAFEAADMDDLARRYEGNKVVVTGKIETEPHPFRHDAKGRNQLRPVITVTEPGQICLANSDQL